MAARATCDWNREKAVCLRFAGKTKENDGADRTSGLPLVRCCCAAATGCVLRQAAAAHGRGKSAGAWPLGCGCRGGGCSVCGGCGCTNSVAGCGCAGSVDCAGRGVGSSGSFSGACGSAKEAPARGGSGGGRCPQHLSWCRCFSSPMSSSRLLPLPLDDNEDTHARDEALPLLHSGRSAVAAAHLTSHLLHFFAPVCFLSEFWHSTPL
eukprot:TRINITY_DN4440_c0_g1_i1.p1 TRINITY_DN4440_c0_g1~~TRINITY_DN4440_c0_g1_i1.p1  ORF type:complete len:208 (+),score=14.55 TRINITY_DN4440_c0_g1_i1:76-699(+)